MVFRKEGGHEYFWALRNRLLEMLASVFHFASPFLITLCLSPAESDACTTSPRWAVTVRFRSA